VATAHWDEAPRELFDEGPLAAYWTDFGEAAGFRHRRRQPDRDLPGKRCYHPRSGKISWRGVGLSGRIEHVDYWDGEG
jgi:hypothetical protein